MARDTAGLLAQLDTLIAKGSIVQMRPHGQQYASNDRLEPGTFADWRTQSLTLLKGLLPPGHPYVDEFAENTDAGVARAGQPDPRRDHRDAGVGILRALREDVASGQLDEIRMAVVGEVMSDFLDMALQLLDGGFHHAATAIAGAVLEDSLRTVLKRQGARSTGNLESLNQVALDSQLYSRIVFQQVKVWIGVRNEVDHGNWSGVTNEQMESFVHQLPGFLGTALQF